MIFETVAAKNVAKGGRNASGYTAGLFGLLSLGVLEKVPQGFAAVRVHNGNITRPRDSRFITEWREGTLYGRYNAGIHVKPPYFQHFEQLDLRDIPTHIKTQIETPALKAYDRRVHDVAATIIWGVPNEFNNDGTKQDFDVTYETILVRALTRAGKDLNDRIALERSVATICTANFRTVMQDYDDPRTATSEDVHTGLSALSEERLMDYGAELRNTFLEETPPTPAQVLKDGILGSALREAGIIIASTSELADNVIPIKGSEPGEQPAS